MEIFQIADEMNRNTENNANTYTGLHCTARMRRCLVLACYIILLLIFVLELVRSISKDGDILALVSSINKLIKSTANMSMSHDSLSVAQTEKETDA